MSDNIIKSQIVYKMNFDLKGHLRSHKVIFIFEIKLSLILLPKKNIYSKLSKNVNILKSLLNFLWTNFDLVFLSFKFYVKILKIIIDYEM